MAGEAAPLGESHTATRQRWTGNFTTWSDHKRPDEEGPPYAEFMFRAEGKIVLEGLKEHCRSSGSPEWVSVATSEKGSYTLNDV